MPALVCLLHRKLRTCTKPTHPQYPVVGLSYNHHQTQEKRFERRAANGTTRPIAIRIRYVGLGHTLLGRDGDVAGSRRVASVGLFQGYGVRSRGRRWNAWLWQVAERNAGGGQSSTRPPSTAIMDAIQARNPTAASWRQDSPKCAIM